MRGLAELSNTYPEELTSSLNTVIHGILRLFVDEVSSLFKYKRQRRIDLIREGPASSKDPAKLYRGMDTVH